MEQWVSDKDPIPSDFSVNSSTVVQPIVTARGTSSSLNAKLTEKRAQSENDHRWKSKVTRLWRQDLRSLRSVYESRDDTVVATMIHPSCIPAATLCYPELREEIPQKGKSTRAPIIFFIIHRTPFHHSALTLRERNP